MQKNNKAQNQSKGKKEWYKKWWGILLIIFVFIPLFFMVFSVTLILNSPRQKNQDIKSQQQTTNKGLDEFNDQQAEDEAAAKELTKMLIEDYVPTYCETHQQKSVPLPPADGGQYGDGKNNLTTDECRAIITYLVERAGSSAKSLESISNAKISIGMSRHELLMAWGLPDDINSTHTTYGDSAQWVYGNPIYNANYVYLDNDIITSIQN